MSRKLINKDYQFLKEILRHLTSDGYHGYALTMVRDWAAELKERRNKWKPLDALDLTEEEFKLRLAGLGLPKDRVSHTICQLIGHSHLVYTANHSMSFCNCCRCGDSAEDTMFHTFDEHAAVFVNKTAKEQSDAAEVIVRLTYMDWRDAIHVDEKYLKQMRALKKKCEKELK